MNNSERDTPRKCCRSSSATFGSRLFFSKKREARRRTSCNFDSFSILFTDLLKCFRLFLEEQGIDEVIQFSFHDVIKLWNGPAATLIGDTFRRKMIPATALWAAPSSDCDS